MKSIKLFVLFAMSVFSAQASIDERLVVPAKQENAILYTCYDSITNGVKGAHLLRLLLLARWEYMHFTLTQDF